jgi:uncharacterized membrane protein AbrB (regulator of aidB expression)
MTNATRMPPSQTMDISHLIMTVLLAGLAGELVWEIWARFITPLWVGGPLEPAALVQDVFKLKSRLPAEIIHVAVGLIAYPIGYLFIAQPVARAVTPFFPWWVVALGYGVGLWIFALYIMAHLFAGHPPFLGFIPLTWASLIGHLAFAVALGAVVNYRQGQ